jgi:hypothetical protein
MAVIVRHNEEPNDQFVLLGTGFGMFKAMRGLTLGDIVGSKNSADR